MDTSRHTATRFLELYNHVDQHLRRLEGSSPHIPFSEVVGRLSEKMPHVRMLKAELSLMGRLRNAIVHEGSGTFRAIAEPRPDFVDEMQRVADRLTQPLRAPDVWVPRERIRSTTDDEPLIPLLLEMLTNGFSMVPILNDAGFVTGLVPEFAATVVAQHDGQVAWTPETRVRDLGRARGIKSRTNPTVHAALVWTRECATVAEIVEQFAAPAAGNPPRRILLALVTEDGSPGSPLRGLLTPWDFVGGEDSLHPRREAPALRAHEPPPRTPR